MLLLGPLIAPMIQFYTKNILRSLIILDRTIHLGNSEEVPLVTVDDSAFLQFPWLIKCYNKNTQHPQQWFFNKNLHLARLLSKNAYGKLKGRRHILYKRTECELNSVKLHSVKYVVMGCIILDNFSPLEMILMSINGNWSSRNCHWLKGISQEMKTMN